MKLSVLMILLLPIVGLSQATPENLDWDGDGDNDFRYVYSQDSFMIVDQASDIYNPDNYITVFSCDGTSDFCYAEPYAEGGIVRSVFWFRVYNYISMPPPLGFVYGISVPSGFVGASVTVGFQGGGQTVGDGSAELSSLRTEWIESLRPTPGSLEDFELSTGVNDLATDFPRIKEANQGDSLVVRFDSSGGAYDFETPLLAAQLFVTGSPPAQPSGFPEVWVNPSPFASFPVLILFDGNDSAFSPGFLPPGGTTLGFTIPLFLSGHSIMLQAFSLAPSPLTGNSFFTASDAHEIRVL